MKPIYLDYNATTPIDQRVVKVMQQVMSEVFGNPSSIHALGSQARQRVEKAREQVARLIGCKPYEIIFTSGGSESNNLAIKGVALAYRDRGRRIITSKIEHPSVLEVCRYLGDQGFEIVYLPVDRFGMVDPEDVARAITHDTILISIMHANNEVGTIQPIEEIAKIARRHGVLLHSDCAQTVGKIEVKVDKMQVDLITIAGHKLYAPKGVGALYVRDGIKLEPLIHGAKQERGVRAGTENLLGIVGLGEACALSDLNLFEEQANLRRLRDRLEQGLQSRIPGIRINGHPQMRLPNTLSVSFLGLDANTLLSDLVNVAASPGAACHAGGVDVSHVLRAMGVPDEYALGTIRLSVGRYTDDEEIDQAIDEIVSVAQRLSKPAVSPVESKDEIKLTHYTHGLGCACKLRPQMLEKVLSKLPPIDDRNVLVGIDTADDAAVYKISDNIAIVETVDFFTPIVDDPYDFGAIAAANSLSDIYAMGAKPLFALSVVGFPSNRLPVEVLETILKGASDKAAEAGMAIIGGHTVDDNEPKFGLAVTAIIDPRRIVKNSGARAGDRLVLTKPIGTGILTTALKRGLIDKQTQRQLVATMAALNAQASEAMQAVGVDACTDVTGFGLLGHLLEIVRASGVSAEISISKIKFLPQALELAAVCTPGGTMSNLDYTTPYVAYAEGVSDLFKILLNDAQTSGGLLIAVAEAKLDQLIDQLACRGCSELAVIGRIVEKGRSPITVLE